MADSSHERRAISRRYILLLRGDAGDKALAGVSGARIARAADYKGSAVGIQDLPPDTILLFDELGIAVVNAQAEPLENFRVAANPALLALEAEQGAGAPARAMREPVAEGTAFDESACTWGLQSTAVAASRFTGRGVRVAVLDTGLHLNHPDFAARSITAQAFVAGAGPEDAAGHGTHCIGTACGPRTPGSPPRYGIACGAEIFAGKVLNDAGGGSDLDILAGINWAVANRCRVVSLSFGIALEAGQRYSRIYEAAARRALDAGTLLIAAAGNVSARSLGIIAPVVRPANCPSILAVGAVNAAMAVVDSSCRGLRPGGGRIDLAAPGAAVHSSWPGPGLYRRFSGTSMAAPFVAGIAALHLEAHPSLSARELWRRLTGTARPLDLPSADVGSGLVQAP